MSHPSTSSSTSSLKIEHDALSVELDPVADRVMIGDGAARWEMRSSKPGLARVTVGEREYVLGGSGDTPIEWKLDGAHRLAGTGRLAGVDIGFKVSFEVPRDRRLRCRIEFDGPAAGKIATVRFPAAPVVSGAASRLVLPQWLGLLVSPEGPALNVRRTVWLRPWCMRFVGATQPTPAGDRSCLAIANDSLYRNIDIWRADGRLGYDYVGDQAWTEKSQDRRAQELEFQFLDGNYVAIAQRYRQWMMTQPDWRTLASRQRPCREKLVGGAILFAHVPCDYGQPKLLSFDELIPRVEALKAAGIERAMFHVGGWNQMGYDSHYPDILPANPRCGGDDGMRRLTDAIDKTGYLCAPHDDIAFMSALSPLFDQKWIARQPGGKPIVETREYREQTNYLVSGPGQEHFARLNMPEVHKRFPNLHGYLFDVSTSVPPLEDHITTPPVSRAEDIRIRREAFRVTREQFAEFIMGESIVDWNLPYYDAAFMAEEGTIHRGDGGWAKDELHGEIVPIWELVYHDSVIALREATLSVNTPMDTSDTLVRYLRVYLKTLRAGTLPPCFYSDDLTMNVMDGLIKESKTDCGGWSGLGKEKMLATVSRISTWLADDIFNEPMIDHRFEGGDLCRERTEFGGRKGKTVVYVNTALDQAWSPEAGLTLPPLGFYLAGPGLLAYHATEVAGRRLERPTLAAFKGEPKAGKTVAAYRAFGDEVAPVKVASGANGSNAVATGRIAETCKTVKTVLMKNYF